MNENNPLIPKQKNFLFWVGTFLAAFSTLSIFIGMFGWLGVFGNYSPLLQSGFGWAFVLGWPIYLVGCIISRISKNLYCVDPRGGEKYWFIGEDGKVVPAESRWYLFGEINRLFVTMPILYMGVVLGDGSCLYRFNFNVLFSTEVDRDVATAFCKWYQAIPIDVHDLNKVRQYLHGGVDSKLPFTVVPPGRHLAVA